MARRYCDEKMQGCFGWDERAGGHVVGSQAKQMGEGHRRSGQDRTI